MKAATKWLKNMTIISFLAGDKLIPINLHATVTSVSIDTVCNVKFQAKFLEPSSPYFRIVGRQIHSIGTVIAFYFVQKLILKHTTCTSTIRDIQPLSFFCIILQRWNSFALLRQPESTFIPMLPWMKFSLEIKYFHRQEGTHLHIYALTSYLSKSPLHKQQLH